MYDHFAYSISAYKSLWTDALPGTLINGVLDLFRTESAPRLVHSHKEVFCELNLTLLPLAHLCAGAISPSKGCRSVKRYLEAFICGTRPGENEKGVQVRSPPL